MKYIFIALLFLFFGTAFAQNNELNEPLIEGSKVAFFGITFIDTSTEGAYNGAREDEIARVELLNEAIIERMSDEGFELVDMSPVQAQIDQIQNPADCYGCDVRMAKELGADYALTGEVQKVSNLILSMNLVLRSTEDEAMKRGLSVDIRSNTDGSWLKGLNYIFKYHYFPEE